MTIDNLEIEIKSSSEKASTGIDKLTEALKKLNNTSAKSKDGLGSLKDNLKGLNLSAKLGAITIVANRTGKAIGNLITKSNEYVENLNLFTVSLGEFADEAKQYAEEVSELMGIDPSDWLRAQGVFNTLATGFGLSSKKASIMSKNLTQLSYDISSLYNIKVADAMTKLQSAFSGELEPVRRLGYDLSQTKLQTIAYAKGIDLQVSEMTQAEKSMLRYYALMTQVTEVQGDMSRTLETPANQLRIFNAQLTQLSRALGNIFIPLLNEALPYLIAMTKVLRNLANEIALFFGYELPEIDYSTVNNLGSETSDNLDDATNSAKKLKNEVAGFDELNIIGDNDGGGLDDALNGLRFDFDLPEYDFLAGLTETKVNEIAEKLEKPFKEILKTVGKIGLGIAGWKLGTGILDFTNSLQKFNFSELNNLRVPVGLTMMITGLSFAFEGAKAIGKGDASLWDYIKTAIGSALGIGGALLTFGTTPVGWAIGIGAVITVNVIGFVAGIDETLEETVNKAFYEYTEGAVDVDVLTDYFTDLIEETTKVNDPIINAGNSIKDLGEKAQTAGDNVKSIATALQFGIETAEINVPTLVEQFKNLATNSKLYSNETYDNIIRGVSTSLREALTDAGYNVPLIIKELEELKQGSEFEITQIEQKLDNLNKSFETGDIGIEEFGKQAEILYDQLADISGIISPTEEAFKGVALTFEKGINFKDENEVKKALDEIATSADNAMTNIETAFATLRLNVKDANLGTELETALLSAISVSEENQKSEIRTKVEEYANVVQTELIKAMEREYEALKEDYQNLNPVQKLFAGYGSREGAGYTEAGLKKYRDGIVAEIVGEIQTIYDKSGVDSKPFATETMNEIIDNLFDYKMSRGHGSVLVFGNEVTTEIQNALNSINVDTESTNVGKNIIQGISNGMTGNEEIVNTATEGLTNNLITTTKEQLGIHSPSTVFYDIGYNTNEGLANGITENTFLVTDAMETMLNSMIERVETFTNRVREALNSMLSDFARSMSSMEVDEDGEVSYSKISKRTIPRFATGGFPENGLFYANSTELVGKFANGKTAVANNEQITEGIATAVYNAIVSANQTKGDNNYNLYIDGKQVNASVEKVKKEKGASIMTGGLIYG